MIATLRSPGFKRPLSFNVPASFADLSAKQLVVLANMLSVFTKTQACIFFILHVAKLRVMSTGSFTLNNNLSGWMLRRGVFGRRFLLADRDVVHLSGLLSWLFDKNGELNITLSTLPDCSHFIRNPLITPGPALTTLSFEQYTHADTHFQNFATSKNVADLNKMVCALCTPSFNSDNYLDLMPQVEKLNYWIRIVLFWYFLGSRRVLTHVFPNLFSSGSGDDKPSDVYLQYMALTSSMCESPADISAVKKQLAWDVFSFLEEKIKANKKLEEQLKKYK